jgi:transcriptional regulator with GAF, ATPase, and Fis domain
MPNIDFIRSILRVQKCYVWRGAMKYFDKETIIPLTRDIFKSQDPEKILKDIFVFLGRYIPLDYLNLPILDIKEGTLRYRAGVSDEEVTFIDETIRLSDTAKKEARFFSSKKIYYLEDFFKSNMTKEVATHFGIENPGATITLFVETGPSLYVVFGLVTWDKNRYTPIHVHMIEELYDTLASAARHILSMMEIASLKERLIMETHVIRERLLGQRIIGGNAGLKEVMSLVKQCAPLNVPVLLMGETGVGKEVVAHTIHRLSKRSDGPMISINCGAIPDTLLDSELFGYEKGAFTGASNLKLGYFEQADRGTIFMDEIGELTPQAQAKLLRVMQDMTFQRVGGKRPISVNVRVIAATNRDLVTMIASLQFRKDLWFRLNVFPIFIPPLRERKKDIPALAEYFARQQSMEMNLPHRYEFASEAFEQLQDYNWPGNVRELKNAIERALITSQGKPLSFPNLSGISTREQERVPITDSVPYATLDEVMIRYIEQTLIKSKGQITGSDGAAELLGINPSTLRARMKKFGIQTKKSL